MIGLSNLNLSGYNKVAFNNKQITKSVMPKNNFKDTVSFSGLNLPVYGAGTFDEDLAEISTIIEKESQNPDASMGQMVQELNSKYGANASTREGYTLAATAAWFAHPGTLKVIKAAFGDLNKGNPIFSAVRAHKTNIPDLSKKNECIEFLLKSKVNLDYRDSDNNNLAHLAVSYNKDNPEPIKLFAKYAPELFDEKNIKGKFPLDLMPNGKDKEEVKKFLLQQITKY